jgi:hypothetical protein
MSVLRINICSIEGTYVSAKHKHIPRHGSHDKDDIRTALLVDKIDSHYNYFRPLK